MQKNGINYQDVELGKEFWSGPDYLGFWLQVTDSNDDDVDSQHAMAPLMKCIMLQTLVTSHLVTVSHTTMPAMIKVCRDI